MSMTQSVPSFDVPNDSSYMSQALCREADPEIFYPERGHQELAAAAKVVCHHCEVEQKCLSYALYHEEEAGFGIWGGKTQRELSKIRRELGITARSA